VSTLATILPTGYVFIPNSSVCYLDGTIADLEEFAIKANPVTNNEWTETIAESTSRFVVADLSQPSTPTFNLRPSTHSLGGPIDLNELLNVGAMMLNGQYCAAGPKNNSDKYLVHLPDTNNLAVEFSAGEQPIVGITVLHALFYCWLKNTQTPDKPYYYDIPTLAELSGLFYSLPHREKDLNHYSGHASEDSSGIIANIQTSRYHHTQKIVPGSRPHDGQNSLGVNLLGNVKRFVYGKTPNTFGSWGISWGTVFDDTFYRFFSSLDILTSEFTLGFTPVIRPKKPDETKKSAPVNKTNKGHLRVV